MGSKQFLVCHPEHMPTGAGPQYTDTVGSLCDVDRSPNEQVSVVNKLLQVPLASKYELVDDCIQVLCCKGIFQNDSEAIHVHPQLSGRILPRFQQSMLVSHQRGVISFHEAAT